MERIKDWLKYFFAGFFLDEESYMPKRGFTHVFISLIFAFLFFMFGYAATYTVPFNYKLSDSSAFTSFLCSSFGGKDGICISAEGGKLLSGRGGEVGEGKYADTYSYPSDVAYAVNGYNLVVDTRPSDMPIEFSVNAVYGNDEITYQSYLALADDEREKYTVRVDYTDTTRILTSSDIAVFTAYFDGLLDENGSLYNSSAAEEYAALDVDSADYAFELYALYVKYYYPDINSTLSYASVPVLRDYYYSEYILAGEEEYLFIFDNMIAVSFMTDGGQRLTVAGYSADVPDGTIVTGDMSGEEAAEAVKGLICTAYYSSFGSQMISYFMSAVMLIPQIIFFPLVVAVIMWVVCALAKCDIWKKFTPCYKAVGGFVLFSSLIAVIAALILSFFITAADACVAMVYIYAGVLIVRTAVLCVRIFIRKSKGESLPRKIIF